MSRSGNIELPFAGEDREFRLPVGRLRAVQEKCDAGPAELLRRYMTGTWRVDDLREVILQGLLGGGLEQHKATRLVQLNFDEMPLLQFVPLAQAIVQAALIGSPDEDDDDDKGAGGDPPGEADAGGATATSSLAGSSASPGSTEKAPRSASRRARSTSSRSGS